MRFRSCNPEAFYPVASPVAHTFAGFWTFLLLTSRLKVRLVTACRQYLPQLVFLVFLANNLRRDPCSSDGIVGTTPERSCHASRVQNASARGLQLQPDAIE